MINLRKLSFVLLGLWLFPKMSQAQFCPTYQGDYGINEWKVHAFNDQLFSAIEYAGYYTLGNTSVTELLGDADDIEFNTCTHGWWAGADNSTCLSYDNNSGTVEGGAFGTPMNVGNFQGNGILCPAITNTPGGNSILAKRQGFESGYYRLILYKYDDQLDISIDIEGDGIADWTTSFDATTCCWQNEGTYGELWAGHLGANSRVDIQGINDIIADENYLYCHLVFMRDAANTLTTNNTVNVSTCIGGTIDLDNYDSDVIAAVGSGSTVTWYEGNPIQGGMMISPTDYPLQNIQTLGQSDVDFSDTQGTANGEWQYGSYEGTNYTSFTQMTYNGTFWETSGTTLNLPTLTDTNGHPSIDNPNLSAVRRWISNHTGIITMCGTLEDLNTDNTGGCFGSTQSIRILVNGVEVYSAFNINAAFDYCVSATVNAGDFVDFIVDADGDASCDDTYFTAHISANQLYAIVDNDFDTQIPIIPDFYTFDNNDIDPTTTNVTTVTGNDGEIQLCINDGTGPYNIELTPNVGTVFQVAGTCNFNYVIAGLSQGVYSASITDANGCNTIVNNLAINAPNCTGFQLSSVNPTDVTCTGANDGTLEILLHDEGTATTITVELGNGIPPQTFPVSGTDPFLMTDLPAGTYNVALFDNNGCEVTYLYNPVVITEPNDVNISGTSTNTTSLASADGTIQICASGGSGGFSASINPTAGNTTNNTACGDEGILIDNLPAGTYEVTVTDANGCSDVLTFIINDPTCPISIDNFVVTDIDCNGDNTGVIDFNIVNGTSPFSYSFDGGMTFSTPQNNNDVNISDLNAGVYDLLIQDDNACQFIINNIIINENEMINLDADVQHVSNNGGTNGNIGMCITGGIAPYTITTSPNTGTLTDLGANSICDGSFDLSNLPAGVYDITITDDISCSQTFQVEVLEPTCPGFGITDVQTNDITCYGANNGNVIVSLTGGTAPFTYQLSGIQDIVTNNSVQTISGLDNGMYELIVTDANGCVAPYSGLILINEPEPLGSIIVNLPPCPGESNGTICLTPEYGTAGYTYNLEYDDNPVTVETGASSVCGGEFHVNDAAEGQYFVELVDANGCIAHALYELPSFGADAQAIATPTCTGQSLGAVDVIAVGTAPFTYSWSNNADTESIENLAQNTYTVTVTDNRGCQTVTQTTVGLSDLSLDFFIAETCIEQSAGAIITTVTGGVPVYQFNWSNNTMTTNETLSNLDIGTYSVTVTDARGCEAQGQTEVTEYDMEAELIVQNTCVDDNKGSIVASPLNGIPGFTFNWSNFENTSEINDLAIGTYTVTITDLNGCTVVSSATVEDYELTPVFDVANVCAGQENGSISVTVDNATDPINFEWSNNLNGNPLLDVPAGTYTVTITDAIGCQTSGSTTIGQFDSPVIVMSPDTEIEEGEFTQLSADVTGGTTPYTYQWIPANGTLTNPNGPTTDAFPVQTTTYTLVVTDANGCVTTADVTVTVFPPAIVVMPTAFSPNGDTNNDTYGPFVPNANADITGFKIFDRWGVLVHDDPTVDWDGTYNGKEQPIGTYVYLLEYIDLLGRSRELKGHCNLVR